MAKQSSSTELLHRVFGSVEVARAMIDRSASIYESYSLVDEREILEGLTYAADALAVVASSLQDQLRRQVLIPVAS